MMAGAASFASSVVHFCQELEEFWAYQVQLMLNFFRMLVFRGYLIFCVISGTAGAVCPTSLILCQS